MAKSKWWNVRNATGDEAELEIYDEIGWWGTMAKDFSNDLKGITAKTINLRINSPGGYMTEGHAIYNRLKEHPARVITHIDGLAASMATVIALAGDEVRIAESALFMIHNPSGLTHGEAADLRKYADRMDKMKSQIVDIYHEKTGIDKGELGEMMDAETWLTGNEAVEQGFADTTYEGLRAAANIAGALGKVTNRTFKRCPVVVAASQPATSATNIKQEETAMAENNKETPKGKAGGDEPEAKFTEEQVTDRVEREKKVAVEAAMKSERERRDAILDLGAENGIEAEAAEAVKNGTSVADFTAQALKAVRQREGELKAKLEEKPQREALKPSGEIDSGTKSEISKLEDKIAKERDPVQRNRLTKQLKELEDKGKN